MFPFPLFILLSNFFVFRTGIIHAFLNVFTEPTVLLFHIRMEEFVGDCSTLTDALQNGRHCCTNFSPAVKKAKVLRIITLHHNISPIFYVSLKGGGR